MAHLDAVSAILTALGPLATAVLGYCVRRSDQHKLRKLNELAHEVRPNGGASLRDAVDRIEGRVTEATGKVAEINRRLEQLAETVDVNQKRIEYLEHPRRMTRRGWRR